MFDSYFSALIFVACMFVIVISTWSDIFVIVKCPSLSLITGFDLRSILTDNYYSHFCFLLFMCMEYFPDYWNNFQTICVLRSQVSLLLVQEIFFFLMKNCFIGTFFLIHSVNLYFWFGSLNHLHLKELGKDFCHFVIYFLYVLKLFCPLFLPYYLCV